MLHLTRQISAGLVRCWETGIVDAVTARLGSTAFGHKLKPLYYLPACLPPKDVISVHDRTGFISLRDRQSVT